MSEATALPTEPQPLPDSLIIFYLQVSFQHDPRLAGDHGHLPAGLLCRGQRLPLGVPGRRASLVQDWVSLPVAPHQEHGFNR